MVGYHSTLTVLGSYKSTGAIYAVFPKEKNNFQNLLNKVKVKNVKHSRGNVRWHVRSRKYK